MPCLSTVEAIEMLGESVDAGLINQDTAVGMLIEHTEGRLTPIGALDLLADWQSARARYEAAS